MSLVIVVLLCTRYLLLLQQYYSTSISYTSIYIYIMHTSVVDLGAMHIS